MNFISLSSDVPPQLNQSNLPLVSSTSNSNILIQNYMAPSINIPNRPALSTMFTNPQNTNNNMYYMNSSIPIHFSPASMIATTPFIVRSIPPIPSHLPIINPLNQIHSYQIHNNHSVIHVNPAAATAMMPGAPSTVASPHKVRMSLPFNSTPTIPKLSGSNAFICTSTTRSASDMKSIHTQKQLESDKETNTWVCEICTKSFLHECNLKIHSVIHTDKALHCTFCNKAFARASNLDQHLRVHTNYRPWNCSHCSKSFRQKHSLKDHLRTHTGERPFKCNYCPRAFKVKHNLVTHTRLHTGERPFECTECIKKFASKSSLNGHIRQKHPLIWKKRKTKHNANQLE